MIQELCTRLLQTWRGESRRYSRARRFSSPLAVEELEPREVPSTSPFFLDADNRLHAATDTTGLSYTFTGGYGTQLSVGEIGSAGGGGQFAVIRDGNNRVYLFNGNNNIFTDTGAYAIDIAAGRGQVFIRDGNNQIYVLALGPSLNPNGTFFVTPTMTAGFALEMSVGFDASNVQDFLAYRAGDDSVHVIETIAGQPRYGATGAFAIDIEAGNQSEIFLRAASNQISIATINAATAGGISFLPILHTAAWAIEMDVGRGNPSGNDILAFRAGDSSVHFINYVPGAVPSISYVNLGAFALQIDAGTNEIFTRDFTSRVVYFEINSTGTGATRVDTGAFAADIEVTTTSSASLPIDQLAILDADNRLYVSVNNGGGTAIATFFNTGFIVNDVQGYTMTP